MDSYMLGNVRAVLNGKTSVVAIAKERLALLDKENPRVNAVVECRKEQVLAQAAEIDGQVRQGKAGRLAGAVITVKDNLEVKGLHATAGFSKRKEYVAAADCTAVERLRAEGALILGKTNMPPGAMDVQTDNPVYGRTNHPLFPERTCGGSSGGGACAVRLGISDMDIGNDLMGSIRIPSHFCGIYGFVPSGNAIGLNGFTGGKPMGSTLSQMLRIGLQARTPEDILYVLPMLLECGFPAREARLGERLKIAWSMDCGGLPLSRDSRKCFEAFLHTAGTGHELYELKPEDYPFELARESFTKLLYGAIAAMMPPAACFAARHLGQYRLLDRCLKPLLAAENCREECKQAMCRLMERFDCLVTPVTATPAFPHIKPDRVVNGQPIYGKFSVDGQETLYAKANLGYTTPFFTANPVLSIPVGMTGDGLPVGVQVVCGMYDDLKLLHIARYFQEKGLAGTL